MASYLGSLAPYLFPRSGPKIGHPPIQPSRLRLPAMSPFQTEARSLAMLQVEVSRTRGYVVVASLLPTSNARSHFSTSQNPSRRGAPVRHLPRFSLTESHFRARTLMIRAGCRVAGRAGLPPYHEVRGTNRNPCSGLWAFMDDIMFGWCNQ